MSPSILVTGGTGFVGSHVVSQLLEKGHKIKATARNTQKLQSIFPSASDKLQIVQVPSLTADHTPVLKGVDILVHCASPGFFDGETSEEILNGAYHGTLNLVEAAIKAGVKKIVVTSTMVALMEPDFSNAFTTEALGPDSWGSINTVEQIDVSLQGPGAMFVYTTAKTAAEKKIWEIADKHPEVDITTILPSVVWGPLVPNHPLSASPASLGTNLFIQNLLDTPDRQFPAFPPSQLVDVRDVAKAHVLAVTAPALPKGEHKRLIVYNRNFTWREVVDIIRAKHPELDQRLPAKDAPVVPQLTVTLDNSLTSKALGFAEYISTEKTVLDAFEAVLDWEKRFKA